MQSGDSPTRPSAPGPELAAAGLCAICQSALGVAQQATACPECGSSTHAECWDYNQGCPTYGCSRVPSVERLSAVEIRPSYWGREHKTCAACGAEMLAAAVRCRHCGARFESSRPVEAREFQDRQSLRQREPGLRKTCVTLLVCGILPCTAPITALFGSIWFLVHRRELAALPASSITLAQVGLGVAIVQTLVAVVVGILHQMVK